MLVTMFTILLTNNCQKIGITPTKPNCINEEINSRLNVINARQHSVQNPVPSCLNIRMER
jgi:hypothetical protein